MLSTFLHTATLGVISNLFLGTFFVNAAPISSLEELEGPVERLSIAPGSAHQITTAVTGFYEGLKQTGSPKNGADFVTVSRIDSTTLRWKNRAGIQWTLKLKQIAYGVGHYDRHVLMVQPDCPYFKDGHTQVSVAYDKQGKVKTLLGPLRKVYTRLPNSAEYLKNAVAGQYENTQWGIVSITPLGERTMEWKEEDSASVTIQLLPNGTGCDRDRFLFVATSTSYGVESVHGKILWSEDRTKVLAVTGPFTERFVRVR